VEAGVVDSAPAAVVHAGQPHVYWKHRDGSLWDTYFNGCGYLSSQLSAEGGVDSFYGKIRLGISHAGTEDIGLQQNYRQIANETVMDDLPAIMMGDFNANPKTGLYEIMNNVFQRVGAVDAYVEVHGPDPNMERRENTANLGENTLQQIFSSWATADHIAHAEANPLDLVYVKQSGSSGLKLVPVDARVPRDWTYPSPGLGGEEIDLSDHFPLMVEFSVREA
jgi:hypothetical protein